MFFEAPKTAYDPRRAEEILTCAESWLAHADRLVYSYGSRTFLSGYDLYEPGGRGHIDCSTLVLLVLAGIAYEESPYALGSAGRIWPGRKGSIWQRPQSWESIMRPSAGRFARPERGGDLRSWRIITTRGETALRIRRQ